MKHLEIAHETLCKNTAMRNIKPLLSGTADMTSLQIVLLYAPMAITYV